MPQSPKSTPSWLRVALGLAAVAAVVTGFLVVGPPASSVQVNRRVITVEKGVVQSTVAASGNLQPARELNVNFKSGGTLSAVFVHAGQHVYQGELLAEINPSSANVALEQAQAGLAAAEAKLVQVESDPSGSSSGGSTPAASTAATSPSARAAAYTRPARAMIAAEPSTTSTATTTPTTTTTPPPTTTPTTTTPTTAATPVPRKPAEKKSAAKKSAAKKSAAKKSAAKKSAATKPAASTAAKTTTTPAVSPATAAANIASAKAAVDSAELSVKSAQLAVDETKLYAPLTGTIASIADVQAGDAVSGGATGVAAASSSGSGSGGSGGGGGGSANGSSAAAGAGSSSSAFIVLVDLSGMDLVVPLSESDITKVRPGQAASVTVNALTGSDFAAHVTAVATLPSTSSGVVSYDVTLHLDQLQFGLRPGMTASASIIVSQAQGAVSLPSAAISRTGGQATVTVEKNGKDTVEPVVTGIVGDSATQVVSGLSAGDQVVISTQTNLGAASATGAAGGGGGFAARALGGGGGAGAVFFGGGVGGGAARRGG